MLSQKTVDKILNEFLLIIKREHEFYMQADREEIEKHGEHVEETCKHMKNVLAWFLFEGSISQAVYDDYVTLINDLL